MNNRKEKVLNVYSTDFIKKVAVGMMAVSMVAPTISTPMTTFASDGLQINIAESPNIDVALTVGNTNVSTATFEGDLKRELQNRGIDPTKVSFQSVKTSTVSTNDVDAQSIFNTWENYPDDIGKWRYDETNLALGSTVNTRWSGFWNPNAVDEYNYNFKFKVGQFPTQDGDNIGWTFRMQETGINQYSHYAFIWNGGGKPGHDNGASKTGLYKVVNRAIPLEGHSTMVTDADRLVEIPWEYNWESEVWQDVEIDVKGNRIQIWIDGIKHVDYVDKNNPLTTGGYGPFTYSQAHAYFKDLTIATEVPTDFKEVVRSPEWREGSERFIVNLDNNQISDFDDPQDSGEILTRLINEEIDYVAVGSSTNQVQAENFISRNNNEGEFIDSNTDYSLMVQQVADYIQNEIKEKQASSSDNSSRHILLGDTLDIAISPESLKTQSSTELYPDGRWRIDHDYDYFENDLGQESWSGKYQEGLNLNFTKPGRYELWFEDYHPSPRYIYVHRRPVADFSLNVTDTGTGYSVKVNNASYDLDLQSQSDRGIAEYEWKWRETTATTWNDGQIPSTLADGKDYIVQLRVKDHQGVWSQPQARYITTSDIVAKPVANFEMPMSATVYENVNVKNTSYDPAGRTLGETLWTVMKNGTQVYSGSTPITNFKPYGEGSYTVGLKVKNSAGVWSEEFKRTIAVSVDKSAPQVTASPTSQTWTPNNVTVTANFTDQGGSGFVSQRYVVSNSSTAPSTGWSEWDTNPVRTVTLTSEGEHYIHLEAKDGEGNVLKRTIGSYQIDKTAPTAPSISANKTTPTNTDVEVSITYPSDTVLKQVRINGGAWTTYSNPVVFSENGTIEARGIDRAGNISTVRSYQVANIDRVAPVAPTLSADKTVITNGNVVVTASFPSDSHVKEVRVNGGSWNAYTTPVTMTNNGKVEVRATDNAGNVSSVTSYEVNNIDKVAPTTPLISANETKPTFKPVSVSATFSSDTVTKEYRVNDGQWLPYTTAVVLKENGKVEVRGKDNVGNVSSVSSYVVDNIEHNAPVMEVSQDVTSPTNKPVALTVTGTDGDSGVSGIYTPQMQNGLQAKFYTHTTVGTTPPLTKNGVVYETMVSQINLNGNPPTGVPTDFFTVEYSGLIYAPVTGTYNFQTNTDDGVRLYVDNQLIVDKWIQQSPTKHQGAIELEGGKWYPILMDYYENSGGSVAQLFWKHGELSEYELVPTQNFMTLGEFSEGESKQVTVSENGKHLFVVEDVAGNKTVKEVEISNIDKTAPKTPSHSVSESENKVALSGKEEGGKLFYRVDSEQWVEYTDSFTTSDGTHKVEFKSVDEAGNESTVSTVTVFMYRDTLKEAVGKVESAEKEVTQENVNVAYQKVDLVPHDASEYQPLKKRVDDLQALLDAQKALEEAMDSRDDEALADAKQKIDLLDSSNPIIIDLLDEVEVEYEKAEILTLVAKERYDLLKEQHEMTRTSYDALVNIYYAIKYTGDYMYGYAEDKVALVPVDDKHYDFVHEQYENLMEDYDQFVEERIQTDAEIKAEASVQVMEGKYDPTLAVNTQNLINAVEDATVRANLQQRLDTAKAKYEASLLDKATQSAITAVEKAESTKNSYYVSEAYKKVNALTDETLKAELTARLQSVELQMAYDRQVTDATRLVQFAEQYKSQYYIDSAQKKIDALPDGEDKTSLQQRLDAVKSGMTTSDQATVIKNATNYVSLAQTMKSQYYVDKAQGYVDQILDEVKKAELQAKLDAIVVK